MSVKVEMDPDAWFLLCKTIEIAEKTMNPAMIVAGYMAIYDWEVRQNGWSRVGEKWDNRRK